MQLGMHLVFDSCKVSDKILEKLNQRNLLNSNKTWPAELSPICRIKAVNPKDIHADVAAFL